jgi:hypothetical protein
MSDPLTQPTHIVVRYRTPSDRALQTAGHAAIGFAAACGVVVLPIIVNYIGTGDWSKSQFVAMMSAVGVAVLGVLLTYCTKYVSARMGNQLPTVAMLPVGELPESVKRDLP